MRKLIKGLKVGLLVVGLLVIVANPAMAQFMDPLTMATSGVLLPFSDRVTTSRSSKRRHRSGPSRSCT